MPITDDRAILALDLGTKLGWACGVPGTIISGSISFKPGRFESTGIRYLNFVRFIDKMHVAVNIGLVCFEEVRRHSGVDAAHVYGGFLSHLQTWCIANGIDYRGHPVGTIKKFATGKGNASKDDMIAAAKGLGFEPEDDNEADAIHIHRLESTMH